VPPYERRHEEVNALAVAADLVLRLLRDEEVVPCGRHEARLRVLEAVDDVGVGGADARALDVDEGVAAADLWD